ncbi:MAG TPA: RHS repeat-associated core domain-containing protein [Anaerolineae bacterium]|nr:RHS repeat-associated core domain-containing protein [Anaerolineae bacterium]
MSITVPDAWRGRPQPTTQTLTLTAAGGRWASPDRRVRLEFPAQARAAARELVVQVQTPATPYQPEGRFRWLTVDVSARDTRGLERGHLRFAQPVTLTFDLTDFPAWLSPYVVHQVDAAADQWELLPSQYDPETQQLTTQVTTFSQVGLEGASKFPDDGTHYLLTNLPDVSTFTGAATYAYDFPLPAGRAGLAPDLALTYSSAAFNGLLGVVQSNYVGSGWNLGGQIAIVRAIKTRIAPIGASDPILQWDYANDFTLLLGGAAYRLAGPEPLTASGGCRYYAEDAPQLRVMRYTPAGDQSQYCGYGPAGAAGLANTSQEYWVVTTAQGTQYRLGFTADAEQVTRMDGYGPTGRPLATYAGQATGRVAYRWAVDRIHDVSANAIYYHYWEEHFISANWDTAQYPDWIRYTSTITTPDSGAYLVKFIYEQRRAGNDNGCAALTPAQCEWHDDGEAARVYAMRDKSRLDRVRVCPVTGAATDCPDSYASLAEYDLDYAFVEEQWPGLEWILNTIPHETTRLTNITRYGWNAAGQKVALPAATFTYDIYTQADDTADPTGGGNGGYKLVYPRLVTANNGYGGQTTFSYGLIESERVRNWRVTQKVTADGLGHTARMDYFYSGACFSTYDNHNVPYCNRADEDITYALIGHRVATVHTYDYDGTLLNMQSTVFITETTVNRGKTSQTQVRNSSHQLLQQQDTTWASRLIAGEGREAKYWNQATPHFRSSDRAHSGSWALKSTYTPASGAGVATTSRDIDVTPNTTYQLSGWIYRETTAGNTYIDMNDLSGELTLIATQSNQWQYVQGTWNSGANTRLKLRLVTDGAINGPVWFDDIALAPAAAPGQNRVRNASFETSTGSAYAAYTGYVTQTLTTDYPGAPGGTALTRQVDYEYDAYGNVIVELQRGDPAVIGDERRIERSYHNLTTPWRIGFKWVESVYAGATVASDYSNLETQTLWYYDNTNVNNPNAPALLNQGRLRLVGQGIWGATPFAVTRYDYDSWGNVIQVTDPNGHATVTSYNDNGYHQFPTQVCRDPGGLNLCTTTHYYGVNEVALSDDFGLFGQVQQTYDSNNPTGAAALATLYSYDAFGRLLAEARPGDTLAAPTQRYVYHTPSSAPPVVNPGFESLLGSTWSESDPASIQTYTRDATQAYAGTKSLKIVTSGAADHWVGQSLNGWQIGQTYQIRAYIKAASGTPVCLGVSARTDHESQSICHTATGAWQLIMRSVKLPDNATRFLLLIRTPQAGTVYVDEVTVQSLYAVSAYAKENTAGSTLWRRQLYDGLGRVLQTQAEFDNVTVSVVDQRYDARGLVIAQSVPYTATSNPDVPWYVAPAAPAETRTAYDALGRVTQVTAPDGSTTTAQPYGRTTITIDAQGHRQDSVVDAFGNLSRVHEYLNAPQTYEAETLSHQIGSASGGGWLSPAAGQPTGVLTYGPYQTPAAAGPGQVARFRLAIDVVNGSTDAVAQIDVYCNTTQTTLAARTLYRQEFSGGLANFSEFALTFDTTGYAGCRLEYRVHWHGTALMLHDRTWVVWTNNKTTTTYAYDTLGNLLTVTDTMPTPNVTTMLYDALGRKTEMTDPDMGHWYYYYDNAGNLIRQRDARGQRICFYYDAFNRLKGKHYRNDDNCPSNPTLNVTYTYDAFTPGSNYGKGYRTGMSDLLSGNTAWTYDARGRVTQERKTISGNQFYTTYTYDALDRVVTMTYPDGEVVQSTYNAAGQPASLRSTTYNNYPYVNSATYNARGQQLTLGYGNSLTTAYDYYDGAGEPFSMRLQHLTVSSDRLDMTYQYDTVGNVTRLQDQSAAISETLTFTYDALDRLLTVRGAYNATYEYNTIGNLTSSTDLGTLYYLDPAHAHAATHVGGTLPTHRKYTYDANGSMLTRVENGATYTQGWNQENRLQTVTVNGTTTTFTYDGDGVLVKKVVGSATTYYVGPHFEKTSAPEVVTKYYTFGGQRVAMRVCNGSNGSCGTNGVNSTLTYLHSDHLGSASLATNSTGGVVNTMRYTAYGLARPGGTMVTDRRFTGQRYEAGLGLYDYNARFYDPLLGRFLAADTIVPNPANPQSLNRYAYALNNPLRYIDPSGHKPIEETDKQTSAPPPKKHSLDAVGIRLDFTIGAVVAFDINIEIIMKLPDEVRFENGRLYAPGIETDIFVSPGGQILTGGSGITVGPIGIWDLPSLTEYPGWNHSAGGTVIWQGGPGVDINGSLAMQDNSEGTRTKVGYIGAGLGWELAAYYGVSYTANIQDGYEQLSAFLNSWLGVELPQIQWSWQKNELWKIQ